MLPLVYLRREILWHGTTGKEPKNSLSNTTYQNWNFIFRVIMKVLCSRALFARKGKNAL